jgi:hypothetical protein
MHRTLIGVALLMAACSSKPAETPDATVDALDCTPQFTYTPVTVTGTSPHGSLDTFHYASAGYADGFCQPSYIVDFTPDGLDPLCTGKPDLQLSVLAPFSASGTNSAWVMLYDPRQSFTMNATFEATQLDEPSSTPAHITGHFVSHDPAWSFDIAVDLTSQYTNDCPP